MNVKQVLIPTRVAKPGTTVREIFEECSRANTPSLPFCDDSGRIVGRVTLKNILKRSCLPEFMVELAMVLGDELSHMQDMGTETRHLFDSPADTYVQEPHLSITPDSPAVKALAIMERSDTSYLFVVDGECYLGVVTIHSLADALIEFDNPS
ncbi:MAG: CBS domain-containing protein [Gammaproteobacteria bacterium]|nr:CBS domain-containing protein [Gammaproteobacteria bacterium]